MYVSLKKTKDVRVCGKSKYTYCKVIEFKYFVVKRNGLKISISLKLDQLINV